MTCTLPLPPTGLIRISAWNVARPREANAAILRAATDRVQHTAQQHTAQHTVRQGRRGRRLRLGLPPGVGLRSDAGHRQAEDGSIICLNNNTKRIESATRFECELLTKKRNTLINPLGQETGQRTT